MSGKPKISFDIHPAETPPVPREDAPANACLQLEEIAEQDTEAQASQDVPMREGYELSVEEERARMMAQRPVYRPIDEVDLTPEDDLFDAPVHAPAPRRTLADTLVKNGTAATDAGYMAPALPGFVERHFVVLGAGVIALLTLGIGLTTALTLTGNEPAAREARTDVTPAQAQGEGTASRGLLADLTEVAASTPAVVTASAPAQQTLADLPVMIAQAIAQTDDDALETLRGLVLEGSYAITAVPQGDVPRVTLQIPQAAQAYADLGISLINAIASGEIPMAPSLRTPEGLVDVDTLVFTMIQTSLQQTAGRDGEQAAGNMSRGAFVASQARTEDALGTRIYTVQAGDSLAYIALQFFGSPHAYDRILGGNRDTLQSPDMIQVGQRLIIPG